MATPNPDKPIGATVKARVAVIYADQQSLQVLQECFKQFDVELIEITSPEPLSRQKIEGCVVGLDHKDAGVALETLRNSPSNRRCVIFGLEKEPKAAAKFLKFGVSVVLPCPVDRITVIKAIRSTRALLLNEFRRYVRIPIAIEVAIELEGRFYSVYTEEMSGGGLSFHLPPSTPVPKGTFRVAFTLPNGKKLQMNVTVCWSSEGGRMVGVRFDPADPGREEVRVWIDEYLQLS